MQNKLTGKFFTFKFSGRKYPISGVVLDYNDTRTLVRCCHDYRLDGFTIFKNIKVDYYEGDYEKFAAKILKAKNYSFKNEPVIPIDSLENILRFTAEKYKLIQLDNKKGDATDVVKLTCFKEPFWLFDELTTRAKWRYKLTLPEKEIRYISFDNDYLNSLKLVTKFK